MKFIKDLIAKLVGKKLNEETGKLEEVSKTKLVAIIAVLVVAIEKLSPVFGHPIIIPEYIFQLLAGAGLWNLRDSIPTK